ncbi:hypothetical protein [Fodinicola feengrottensis]|uniref:hypothetical protein n=1 Tax=Fodinicola feengrottensis TaxID=435914 RepID=UPI0013D2110F|nr:hypothetical protein [Fodinicola feengrottensis]
MPFTCTGRAGAGDQTVAVRLGGAAAERGLQIGPQLHRAAYAGVSQPAEHQPAELGRRTAPGAAHRDGAYGRGRLVLKYAKTCVQNVARGLGRTDADGVAGASAGYRADLAVQGGKHRASVAAADVDADNGLVHLVSWVR